MKKIKQVIQSCAVVMIMGCFACGGPHYESLDEWRPKVIEPTRSPWSKFVSPWSPPMEIGVDLWPDTSLHSYPFWESQFFVRARCVSLGEKFDFNPRYWGGGTGACQLVTLSIEIMHQSGDERFENDALFFENEMPHGMELVRIRRKDGQIEEYVPCYDDRSGMIYGWYMPFMENTVVKMKRYFLVSAESDFISKHDLYLSYFGEKIKVDMSVLEDENVQRGSSDSENDRSSKP